MTSTIHADKIMNSSGDQDSGVDLLVNDQVKIKTANTDRVTVTDATTTIVNDLAAPTIKTATLKHTGGTTGLTIDSSGRAVFNNTNRPQFHLAFNNNDNSNVGTTDGTLYRITYTQAITNVGTCVADAGGGTYHTFTAPITGLYLFYTSHYTSNYTSDQMKMSAYLIVDDNSGHNFSLQSWSAGHETTTSASITYPIYLTANQTVASFASMLDANATGNTWQIYRNKNLSFFGGTLIG